MSFPRLRATRPAALLALLPTALTLASALFLLLAPAAQANDRFTLDSNPESIGHVVVDAAGNGYFAWTDEGTGTGPNRPVFCKVPAAGTCTHPISLAIPAAVSDTESVSGAFAVLGSGSTVYVVGPRYVQNDVVVWTSTNGGESFGAGVVSKGGYPSKTAPTSVLLRKGNEFAIGAYNAGLGFGSLPAAGGAGTNLSFKEPGLGGVEGSSLALDPSESPIEAYWNLSSPARVLFYRYKGSGPLANEADWEGPVPVTAGYEVQLAGGPGGVYMVSQDNPLGGSEPTQIDVRKFSGTTFGAPTALANDQTIDLFDGGAIAEAPNGLLAVAWPELNGSGFPAAMRLWVSSNGGASFTESLVAHLGGSYLDMENAQMAIDSAGQGWLTYVDENGLQVADLTPLPTPAPPAPVVTPTPPSPAPVTPVTPGVYKGKTASVATEVDGNLLTLTVPKECLAPSQPFYIGVGKRARHRIAKSVRSTLKVVKVTFSLDGKKLETLKKKPFRYLVNTGALGGGSKHTVKARVTANVLREGKKTKVVRTLEGQVSIC